MLKIKFQNERSDKNDRSETSVTRNETILTNSWVLLSHLQIKDVLT